MRTKLIIIISRILCLTLLFRVCFLSLSPVNSAIVSIRHNHFATKNISSDYLKEPNSFEKRTKELTNNINPLLHYFKNRIAENKKVILSFLFCLISGIFLFNLIYLDAKTHSLRSIFHFINLRIYISLSILRI